eukprot:NODE_5206_length_603_cov_221.430657.p3 GENE.NODE_5206_length_603_cov_221.430657~~NODE_5206_length_603_cov_221.430657.p3  ORF type:complete len:90 (-),score=10.07 NODE_5206_length_603_cov_221.430657:186-455(-)
MGAMTTPVALKGRERETPAGPECKEPPGMHCLESQFAPGLERRACVTEAIIPLRAMHVVVACTNSAGRDERRPRHLRREVTALKGHACI